jgi:hypothetical protein
VIRRGLSIDSMETPPMEALFELCDLNLDEPEPLAKAEQLLQQLDQSATGEGEWPGCGPLGRTPLHGLCANSDCAPSVGEAMARLLLASGLPVDQRDERGDTALHVLCCSDHSAAGAVALAHALLDSGAACTLEDAAGRTPCSLAQGAEMSGGWRDDGDGEADADDAGDTGPPQLELADLLRRRMILSHHGLRHRVVSGSAPGEESVVVAGEGTIRRADPPPAIIALPEPEPEPVASAPPRQKLTILLLGPGSAIRSSPERFSAVESQHTLVCPELPEPEDELEECVRRIAESIDESQPDLLLCGSRGAIALAVLLSRGLWRGPSLLLSAVRTVECVCAWREDSSELEYFGAPLCLYHGTEDEVQRIALVRDEALAAPATVQLLEARGEGHSLPSLGPDRCGKRLLFSLSIFL